MPKQNRDSASQPPEQNPALRNEAGAEPEPIDIAEHFPQALRDSEARYRRLFETAQDGILILDAKTGLITDVNPFLMNLLNYTREWFLGEALWDLGFFKDIAASKLAFRELIDGEYVRYDDLPLETKDGRSMWSFGKPTGGYPHRGSAQRCIAIANHRCGDARTQRSCSCRKVTAARPETRVLYTSGYTDDAIFPHGELGPNCAFLEQPFTRDDLMRKVRELLDSPLQQSAA